MRTILTAVTAALLIATPAAADPIDADDLRELARLHGYMDGIESACGGETRSDERTIKSLLTSVSASDLHQELKNLYTTTLINTEYEYRDDDDICWFTAEKTMKKRHRADEILTKALEQTDEGSLITDD